MMKPSLPHRISFVAIGLFILACSTVQITIQLNTRPTPTAVPDASQALSTQTALHTPSPLVIPLTVTFTPTSEPMPRLAPGQTVELTDLIMLADTVGWGFDPGGHVLYTSSGGKTWSDISPPQASYYTKRTFFSDDPIAAWAVSVKPTELRSWQTFNGGRSWQPGETIHLGQIDAGNCGPLHMENPLVNQLYFLDSVKGWMVVTASATEHGYTVSMLFATTDAGAHWELKNLATRDCSSSDGPDGLSSVVFWGPNEGWGGFFQNKFGYYPYNQERYIGGWDIYQTDNAGESWQPIKLPEPPGFLEEAAKSPKENAICGIGEFTPYSYAAFGMQMRCLIFPSTTLNYHYLTFNNGLDWNVWNATGNEDFIVDVDADHKAVGWRFVPSSPNRFSELQRTTDRGMTWSTIKRVAWRYARLEFVDEQVGWAMVTTEMNMLLLKTADGGRTWAPLAPLIEP